MKRTFRRSLKGLIYRCARSCDRMSRCEQRLVFVHVAKCAGTSVSLAIRDSMGSILEPRFHWTEAWKAVGAIMPDAVSMETIEAAPRYHQYLLAYHLHSSRRLICGHLPVNQDLIAQFKNDVTFVTVLRSPVDRWKSHYSYDKIANNNPSILPARNSAMSAEEELNLVLNSRRGWQLAYVPTMMFTGRYPNDRRDAEMLSLKALSTLEDFKVVGFADAIPAFESDFESVTGVKLHIPRINRTTDKLGDDPLRYRKIGELLARPDITHRIEALCEIETRMYQSVKEMCRQRERRDR